MNEVQKEKAQNAGVYIDIHDNGDITVNPNLTEMTVTHHHYDSPFKPNKAKDKLATYIINADVYRAVVMAANKCIKPQDVMESVVPLLLNAAGLQPATIRSKAFIEALIPHLTQMDTNYDNIRKALKI